MRTEVYQGSFACSYSMMYLIYVFLIQVSRRSEENCKVFFNDIEKIRLNL